MKNIKVKKITIFLVSIMFAMFFLTNVVYADVSNFNTIDLKNTTEVSGSEFFNEVMSTGVDVVRTVAAGMAIIGLIAIGIKYIYSSPEGRAGYKKVFEIYLLGIGLLIGGEKIIEIIVRAAEKI